MKIPDVFRRITGALEQAGIAYMLSGSFASAYYGAPRTTQDIDLVIESTPAQMEKLAQLLPVNEYYMDLETALEARGRESMFNIVDMLSGWKIDLMIRKSRSFSRVEFDRRKRIEWQGIALFVASAEDVVVSKLEWAKLSHSSRQIEDVSAILQMRWDSLDRPYINQWVQELGLAMEWNEARHAAAISD